jgi:signal transduction histidine kinase
VADSEAPPATFRIVFAAVGGALLSGVAALVTLSGVDGSGAPLAAAARGSIVAVPVAVGCYAWHRRRGERFGPLLVLTGYAWFFATLSESDDELLYSIGRVAGWFAELQLIYLMLAFPSGRLPERVDRLLVGATALVLVLLYLPALLLADAYPVPAPPTSCTADCPSNEFFVLDEEPGFVDSVLRPVRDFATIALALAVVARLALRVRGATRAMRRTLSPVLAVAAARALTLAVAVAVRRAAPNSSAVEVLTWMLGMALPLMAIAFFVGLLRWRLFVARALERLGARLRSGLDGAQLRLALSEALDDPSLSLAYWVPSGGGRWVDSSGRAVLLPPAAKGRCVTEVREDGRPMAAMVHDEALVDQTELVEATVSYARMALENERLAAKVEASLEEVRDARARILASADEERLRIQRDLHDGAQQRLVGLRFQLELIEDQVREDPDAGLQRLHALGGEVQQTLDELRSLARGVFPPVLADHGLGPALRAVANSSPIPVTVETDGIRRYRREVENAVYFCCLEAMQNAAKHASGATGVDLALTGRGELRFEVRDDGAGFDPEAASTGVGLANMRDRLAALGGELWIDTARGRGVVVRGVVPLGEGFTRSG